MKMKKRKLWLHIYWKKDKQLSLGPWICLGCGILISLLHRASCKVSEPSTPFENIPSFSAHKSHSARVRGGPLFFVESFLLLLLLWSLGKFQTLSCLLSGRKVRASEERKWEEKITPRLGPTGSNWLTNCSLNIKQPLTPLIIKYPEGGAIGPGGNNINMLATPRDIFG